MTNFEKIAKNEEELAKYIAHIINGECSNECPGYPYCNGTHCDIAIEEFLKDDSLVIFDELNIGDRFKVNANSDDNIYMKTRGIYSAAYVNSVNLTNGNYCYFGSNTQVRRTKKVTE